MRFIHKYFEKHNTTVTIWIISCTEGEAETARAVNITLHSNETGADFIVSFLLTVMERSVSGQKWSHGQKWHSQLLNF